MKNKTKRGIILVVFSVFFALAYGNGKISAPVSRIISLKPVAGNVMEMVVNTTDTSATYPQSTTNLVTGSFAGVAHSSDGVAPFTVTNLSYSTAAGSNIVIYVDATDSAKFFGIGAQ